MYMRTRRGSAEERSAALQDVSRMGANNAAREAIHVREIFTSYLFEEGSPTSAPEVQTSPEDDETVAESIIKPDFNKSLEAMQAFFGLEVTGVLDKNTLEVMKSRCGVSDISRYGHFHRKPKWEKSTVTYRITQYTPDLRQSDIDATLAQAFQIYSDIMGTSILLMGPNGVLAHANSPGRDQGGDTHFDDDETWTLSQRGVNLLLMAAHEFGHALGLDHSRDRRALMFPTYQYEPTENPKPDPKPDPRPNPKDKKCNRDLVFDAASSIRGDLYFFKNGYYWRKSTAVQGIRLTKVSSRWAQINYVDAAYEVPAKYVVYLFEGDKYWRIRAYAKTILSGYPKSISNLGFPSSVTKLDASVYMPTKGKTFFFVGNKYWSFDEARR
ncbi:hypothetical protein J4Q44_G00327390 [Coregonus suidteri]|uniref:Peptidase metallopeptidase domain-containing protein n=1 Tax=Coregonus suidteri TaxID=861788 RepID=A0AAN8KPZ5_9TELE